MPEVLYTGHQTLTYLGYFDEATGKTLVCDPGGIYYVAPEMPGDGRFVLVEKTPDVKKNSPEPPEQTVDPSVVTGS
jgi:hypothetical protein